jgi:hypothetical protein
MIDAIYDGIMQYYAQHGKSPAAVELTQAEYKQLKAELEPHLRHSRVLLGRSELPGDIPDDATIWGVPIVRT